MVTITRSLTAIGAALLLFSSPIESVLTGLPSRRPRTIALSVESGVKSAPSGAVIGRADIRPGSSRRQIKEPRFADSR